MTIIKFHNVSKIYKNKKSEVIGVDSISFDIQKGSLIGFVGPNGAGKSTTIKLLSGVLKPTSGQIQVCGMCPIKDRKKLLNEIGIMFGNRSSLWFNIPGIETAYLMRDIYKIPDRDFNERLEKYSSLLNIEDILKKPVRLLSLGQRMKMELLISILHHPKILILDEPTLGFDIVAKKNFRDILRQLSIKENITIFLTTHDLHDVEKICDRVIFINDGEKILDFNNTTFNELFSNKKKLIVRNDKKYNDIDKYRIENNVNYTKYLLPNNIDDQLLREILSDGVEYSFDKISMEDVLYEYYQSKSDIG